MSARRPFIPSDEWVDPRHRRGLWGERIAWAYLVSCGWEIEAHRYRLGRHDVDLIARRGSLVAFVEVKTRRSIRCGEGVEAVGPQKRRVVARVGELWRLRRGRPEDVYRFDVVEVRDRRPAAPVVVHVEDAWRW